MDALAALEQVLEEEDSRGCVTDAGTELVNTPEDIAKSTVDIGEIPVSFASL